MPSRMIRPFSCMAVAPVLGGMAGGRRGNVEHPAHVNQPAQPAVEVDVVYVVLRRCGRNPCAMSGFRAVRRVRSQRTVARR